jgi:hypothetical protein
MTNIPAALRSLFADAFVQTYLRDHDPAALDRALKILAKPDEGISPLDAIRLAECAGMTRADGQRWPAAHAAISDQVSAAVTRAGVENLAELFALARAQSEEAHAAAAERLKDHDDPTLNRNSNLVAEGAPVPEQEHEMTGG